ncbi:CheR family methyltransferase [Parapedobacter koreensis]|uniref:Chemotaxis protein methyltransferase CheR n=1 Tax=Parapedobacter koreensis TaxID=332977 RepID=A0A1H7JAP6_9SPHI|nr:protein-glutamate O-methyltransferase CheR [Parapedobacter koreensis]SEK70365.1 chemotaxis protein methyltransferase CheR [Parapedobacter koreensis]
MGISFENLEELIELINHVHGFDLRGYTRASLKRRVAHIMELYRLDFNNLKDNLVNTSGFFNRFLTEVTVNVTELFRDPAFYAALREEVFPYLATFPHIKLWSAGCSSGEEAYSLAILLKKQGLYERSFIYGTDINSKVLERAKQGIIDLRKMKEYSDNYLQTESGESLSEYYTVRYDAAIMHHELRKNILFSIHNLVSDGVFNEFQLITCRNVLIYFDLTLQQRVLKLLYESLAMFGFLCLGTKESLRSEQLKHKFRLINKKQNIYQKIA